MGKSAKKSEKPVNFVPGWIGGRLTNPSAYDKKTLDKLRKRVEAAKEGQNNETIFSPSRTSFG